MILKKLVPGDIASVHAGETWFISSFASNSETPAAVAMVRKL
jgi:hypothetical protein